MDRYFRWRDAMKMPVWVVDRHWYVMLGGLWAMDKAAQIERVQRMIANDVRSVAEQFIGVPNE